jgi:anaerobic selenocysteine-containing dehydrogenase
LAKIEFLVVQDAFLTATAARAHVVLPAAAWAEEEGSYTNLAGQLGWQRAALTPLGEARPHWRIIAEIARRLNGEGDWPYASAADVLAEVERVVPAYEGALQARHGGPVDVRCEYAIGGELQKPSVLPRSGRGDLTLITAPVPGQVVQRQRLHGRTRHT